jgi:hypothetical protein
MREKSGYKKSTQMPSLHTSSLGSNPGRAGSFSFSFSLELVSISFYYYFRQSVFVVLFLEGDSSLLCTRWR